ncbi:phage tail protein [Glaciimonas sp. PAMC28666]|uniref:phage tail protein n=1 Tax=Glaciimonas sp. PAMC28666 TaxID=2807626 RepID=UPI001962D4C9|nr:phage tail protein [Glaciimonas sp. PAMC28666]QRX82521.1 phage tail protein [Glaciimonas sp. PAMC28666]
MANIDKGIDLANQLQAAMNPQSSTAIPRTPAKPTVFYPPVSFHFAVTLTNVSGAFEGSFSEVTGLDVTRNVIEIVEGGENRFTHRVPGRVKYNNLILKRGLLTINSPLADWCIGALQSDLANALKPKEVTVILRDHSENPLMSWSFTNAWPVKWSLSPLAADTNAIAVETLELAYSYFTRVKV